MVVSQTLRGLHLYPLEGAQPLPRNRNRKLRA
jgi:hypothetical protein